MSPEDEERVARYLAGSPGADERAEFERRLLEEPALAETVYSQGGVEEWTRVALESAVEPASPIAGRIRPAARRGPRLGLPRWALAAAALVVVVGAGAIVTRLQQPRDPIFRSAPTGAVLLEPRGRMPRPPLVFRWSSVPSAAHYRFELTDEESGRVYRIIVPDTSIRVDALPELRSPVRHGTWKVTPLLANGAEVPASPPARFETREP